MTDNEIIKALECCGVSAEGNCRECPLINDYSPCGVTLTANALNLINRQKAEIERLEELVYKLKRNSFKSNNEPTNEMTEDGK